MYEEQAYTFVQFSVLDKHWQFAYISLSIILYPHTSIQKTFDIQKIFSKRSKRQWIQKLEQGFGFGCVLILKI